jgi:N-acetylneuraminate synthase
VQNGARIGIGDRYIGHGKPVYIIAEIGVNHDGSLETAKRMIDGAVYAGGVFDKAYRFTPFS